MAAQVALALPWQHWQQLVAGLAVRAAGAAAGRAFVDNLKAKRFL
jgi:hypothetical protein